jgi:diaminopimelate decarboxylase
LSQALAAGVIVNVESAEEMRRLQRLGSVLGYQPRAVLRINPDFELKSSGMKMGGGPKPFGIDAEAAPAVLREMVTLGVECMGFHIFAGSQNLKPEAIIEAQEKSVELAQRLAEHLPHALQSLNLGGGFGIPYFPGEQPLDLQQVSSHLHASLPRWQEAFPQASIALELGRYLVGEAGIYVCRVVDKKYSRGQCYLVTDGGLHQHLAASGNFGQVIRKNYPVAVGSRMQAMPEQQTGVANVVGPLCTPLDILAEQMPLEHAEVGDLIVVFQSGAYGLSASPQAFLGHPPPVEVLL